VDISHNKKRHRKRSPENSKEGAKIYEGTLRRRLAEGDSNLGDKNDEAKQQKFEEFVRFWYQTHVLVHNKPSTANRALSIIENKLVPTFGKTPISQISTLQVERFKAASAATGIANKTINNDLSTLGRCLNDAKKWLELDRIPEIALLRTPPPQHHFLTEEECSKLLTHLEQPWFDIAYVALRTGLRLGELRALHWADVNLENRSLVVRYSWCAIAKKVLSPKGNATRNIPLSADIVTLLEGRDQSSKLVFESNGHVLDDKKLNRALSRACKKSQIPKITCHGLRHTYASHLAMKGAPIVTIQKLLGHTDIKVTMRYAHLSKESVAEVASLLSEPLV